MCPFTTLLGVGLFASRMRSSRSRFASARRVAWVSTLLILAAWAWYFAFSRRPEVRVALEVASVLLSLAPIVPALAGRAAAPRFGALERYETANAGPDCPVGFGRGPRPARGGGSAEA